MDSILRNGVPLRALSPCLLPAQQALTLLPGGQAGLGPQAGHGDGARSCRKLQAARKWQALGQCDGKSGTEGIPST